MLACYWGQVPPGVCSSARNPLGKLAMRNVKNELAVRTNIRADDLIDVKGWMLGFDYADDFGITFQGRLDLSIVGPVLGNIILQGSVALSKCVEINQTHHCRCA
jgi:hypothetical protein